MAPTRRELIKKTAITIAAAGNLVNNFAAAQIAPPKIKMVQTDVLDIGYEEHGPGNGFPIILLHGFPYDVRAFDGVSRPLTEAGYRVLLPYLRGYGPTLFRDPDEPRMAEQAAIAQDLLDFANVLGLDQFATAGFDWGNRAACITSILHPERVRGQVACVGYSVQDTITPG